MPFECDLQNIDQAVGFDPALLSPANQYKLLSGSVVPRPIAFVSTLGPDGPNAAPFSFFNVVSVDPPTVMFSVGKQGGREKDTLRNIRHLPEFVVHIVNDAMKEKMNICAANFPPGVNELEMAQIETIPSLRVRPARIKACPVQFECQLRQIIPVGNVPWHLVIGEIVFMHFNPGLVNESFNVDFHVLDPIGRLAGAYIYPGKPFFMPIPDPT